MIRKPQLNGDNNTLVLEKKLSLKELELTSLMEVTQAINANLPENDLYKIFHFTLKKGEVVFFAKCLNRQE